MKISFVLRKRAQPENDFDFREIANILEKFLVYIKKDSEATEMMYQGECKTDIRRA